MPTQSATKLDAQWTLLASCAAIVAAAPALIGIGAIIYVFAWPRHIDRTPGGWGDSLSGYAVIGGVILLAVSIPYLVIALGVIRKRLWSVIALLLLTAAQGGFQLLICLHAQKVNGPGLMWITYTAVLCFTAILAAGVVGAAIRCGMGK